MSGSGISWAICKSAPRSRQITTPAPHYSLTPPLTKILRTFLLYITTFNAAVLQTSALCSRSVCSSCGQQQRIGSAGADSIDYTHQHLNGACAAVVVCRVCTSLDLAALGFVRLSECGRWAWATITCVVCDACAAERFYAAHASQTGV